MWWKIFLETLCKKFGSTWIKNEWEINRKRNELKEKGNKWNKSPTVKKFEKTRWHAMIGLIWILALLWLGQPLLRIFEGIDWVGLLKRSCSTSSFWSKRTCRWWMFLSQCVAFCWSLSVFSLLLCAWSFNPQISSNCLSSSIWCWDK